MKYIINFLFILFSVSIGISYGLNKYFDQVTFIQLYHHLTLNFKTLISVDIKLTLKLLYYSLVIPLIVFFVIKFLISMKKFFFLQKFFYSKYFIILFISISTWIFFNSINILTSIKDYVKANREDYSSFNSNIVAKKKQNNKNLIVIYVEALENGYSDKKIFSKDLLKTIKNIDNLTNISFENFLSQGNEYTIMGLISTMCGFFPGPIGFSKVNTDGRDLGLYGDMFAKATCIGDILKKNGYHNLYIGGADKNFTSKYSFLKSHGFHEVYGKNDFKKIYDKKFFSKWGLNDDKLFEFTKKKLLDLKKEKDNFFLSILTLDTHYPDGHSNEFCKKINLVETYYDKVECSSILIKNFIDFLYANDFFKTTNVVITSDQLSWGLNENKIQETKRRIFNNFLTIENENNYIKNRDWLDKFSLYPTLLTFINFEVENGHAGFGFSGFGKIKKENFKYIFQNNNLYNYLIRKYNRFQFSKKYYELW